MNTITSALFPGIEKYGKCWKSQICFAKLKKTDNKTYQLNLDRVNIRSNSVLSMMIQYEHGDVQLDASNKTTLTEPYANILDLENNCNVCNNCILKIGVLVSIFSDRLALD